MSTRGSHDSGRWLGKCKRCGRACSREEFRVAGGEGKREIIRQGELKKAKGARVGEVSRSGSG